MTKNSSCGLSTANASYPLPVHVGPQVLWGIIVDYQLHTLHINASSSSICADKADETQAVGLRARSKHPLVPTLPGLIPSLSWKSAAQELEGPNNTPALYSRSSLVFQVLTAGSFPVQIASRFSSFGQAHSGRRIQPHSHPQKLVLIGRAWVEKKWKPRGCTRV